MRGYKKQPTKKIDEEEDEDYYNESPGACSSPEASPSPGYDQTDEEEYY